MLEAAAKHPPATTLPPIHQESRLALWRAAGLEREESGLRDLADDPHPLVRLIATCALTRRESRGAHRRLDFPSRDPHLDDQHVTVRKVSGPEWELWE
jgi:aspartate oxidase